MWRWLHSLPRAVRQHIHGSGASAGVHVEEHHEVDVTKESKCRWKFQCRQKDRSNKENKNGKQGSKPDSNEFWRCVQNQQALVEAVSFGGVVAMGMEITRLKCPSYQRLEENAKQKLFPSTALHILPKLKNPESENPPVVNHPVSKKEKTKIFLQEEEHQSETKTTFEPTQTSKAVGKKVKTTVVKETPTKFETLEEAFKQFEDICTKYTAVGKGIMGSQEAQKNNYKSAALLWEESSQLGHAKSRFNLAVCYETGKGVIKDLKEAVRLYRLAAEDLHPQAMFNLGMMYIEGTPHTSIDLHKGIELITLAADFGLAEAQCYLGVYYSSEDNGHEKKAVHYLTLSANQKNMEAEYSLALCYQYGYGVDENLCKAASLFHKAAERGHYDAMYSLATFYGVGIGGLPQDVRYSEQLMQKAADNGCQEAIHEIQKSIKESEVTNLNKNVSYLHGCVSLPCLTDLLTQDLYKQPIKINVNSKSVTDHVTEDRMFSQLYSQLLIPHGFNMKPAVTNILDPKTIKSRNKIDANIPRRKGRKSRNALSHDDLDYDDEHFDTVTSCSALQRRTSTMPDLSVVSCV